MGRARKQEGHSAGSGDLVTVQLKGGRGQGPRQSSHWSDLAFFGPVPFISGDETGLFAAGLAAEPSLLVS